MGLNATSPHKRTSRKAAQPALLTKPEKLSWPDFLIMLLRIGAEVEHCLMVQYLYAAYTLGGDQVPRAQRPMVQAWQDSLLAVAKEEMGHLMTVSNLLVLLGGEPNLGRRDYPWDEQYYPFPFELQPLSLKSTACYTYVESPPDAEIKQLPPRKLAKQYREYQDSDRKRIHQAALKVAGVKGTEPHRVGELYALIIELLGDETRIPDTMFREGTYSSQASWDDWGRNFHPPNHMVDASGSLVTGAQAQPLGPTSVRQADLIIVQMATRNEAVAAIQATVAQGEAPDLATRSSAEPSHFDRFLEIYEQLERVKGWSPARNVISNPTTLPWARAPQGSTPITAEPARTWAALFNLRYRMLLVGLQHTFRLARITSANEPSARASVMHRVFGEMYNMKAIANMLVRLPAGQTGAGGAQFAGPPFQIPDTLTLPPSESDCWRLHEELILSAQDLCRKLRRLDLHADGIRFLDALASLDEKALAWLAAIDPNAISSVN